MRPSAWLCLGCVAALLAGLAGCKDDAKAVSNSGYLLELQHKDWIKARDGLNAGEDSYGHINSVNALLGGRTKRRLEKDYTGANKAEVVAKIDSLNKVFQETVMSKLEPTEHGLQRRRGVTQEDVKKAFLAMDPAYQELVAMTK